MVETRRAAAEASKQPAQQPHSELDSHNEQQPKSQRAPRRKAAAAAATSAGSDAISRRRLRSRKHAGSPLQALASPPKRTRTKPATTPATTPKPTATDENRPVTEDNPDNGDNQVNNADHPVDEDNKDNAEDDSDSDPGAGIYFRLRDQPTESTEDIDHTVSEQTVYAEPPMEGSSSAIALLKKIEAHSRPKVSRNEDDFDMMEASLNSAEVVHLATPAVETPKQRGFFGKIFSAIRSPFSASPLTSTPLPAQQSNIAAANASPAPLPPPTELTMNLTPTPTPVGERRIKSKTKRTKNHRHAMVNAITKSVQDPAEQSKAEAWAQEVIGKLPKGSAILGDKRKRLEGGVTVGELKNLSTKPWKSGTYGLDDDLFDLSDSEEAPAWAVLQDMLLEEQNDDQPPAKKLKSNHNVDVDMQDITSLNDTTIPDPSTLVPDIVNTSGNSADRWDLRPRSSIVPSPMFESSAAHLEESNVFNEGNQALAEQLPAEEPSAEPSSAERRAASEKRDAFERELRRTGHVPGSGSFCVPEGSSDEEDSMDEDTVDEAGASALWTQQPPPAPIPGHASLPTPLAESPAVPAVALDPIEFQRAKITKHTPAKPSRLREVHVPSPSLKSDAGNDTMMQSAIAASPGRPKYKITPCPDVKPLDIPQEILDQANTWLESDEGKARRTNSTWDDPAITYDENPTNTYDDEDDEELITESD